MRNFCAPFVYPHKPLVTFERARPGWRGHGRAMFVLSVAAVVLLAAGDAFAAPVTWLLDDREIHGRSEPEGEFSSQTVTPSPPFAFFDESIVVTPDEFTLRAWAEQTSQVTANHILGGGGAMLEDPAELLVFQYNAHSLLSLTFELDADMPYTFSGSFAAFAATGFEASVSARLTHQQTATDVWSFDIVQASASLSESGTLLAGTYEYRIQASTNWLGMLPSNGLPGPSGFDDFSSQQSLEPSFTAVAAFDNTQLTIIPAPGAFAGGMVMLGGLLLHRRRAALSA